MESISRAAQAVQSSAAKSAHPPEPRPSDSPAGRPDAFSPFNPAVHPKARAALEAVKAWTRNAIQGNGHGLVLWASSNKGGNGYGNGKTLLAKCAANALYANLTTEYGIRDTSGMFLTTEQMLNEIKASYDTNSTAKYFNQIKRARFLILDDFGTEYAKDMGWLQEQFYKVLNYAYDARQPLMLTSNMPPADMQERLGGKNWSRFRGMTRDENFINLSEVPDQRKRT